MATQTKKPARNKTIRKAAAPRKPVVEIEAPGYAVEVDGEVELLLRKADGSMGTYTFHPRPFEEAPAKLAWILRGLGKMEKTGDFGPIADLVELLLPEEEVAVVMEELSLESLAQLMFALLGADPS